MIIELVIVIEMVTEMIVIVIVTMLGLRFVFFPFKTPMLNG